MIDQQDLQAKSDQMNAIDFVKPMTFLIEKVEYNPRQPQPIKMHFKGYPGRPYKPSKGMLRGLVQVWGDDEQAWTGRMIELFCNPSVKWAGEAAGGIQIAGLSHIEKPAEVVVRINRSQRELHIWNVIPTDHETKTEFVLTHHEASIAEAESNEAIDAIVKSVKAEFGNEALAQLKEAVVEARAKLGEAA